MNRKMDKQKSKESEEHWVLYNNKKHVLYPSQNSMNCAQVTSNLGSGHVRQLFSCPFAQIKDFEIIFCDSMCGGAKFSAPRTMLYFCLTGE